MFSTFFGECSSLKKRSYLSQWGFKFSFIKMSDRDLKFVYLFCQTDTFLFVIETPIRKCKHPFNRNLQNVEH